MFASFLITFREALEAALIVGIVAAYLARIERKDLNKYLYLGVFSAILASIFVGILFLKIYGGLVGRTKEVFEGLASILASIVLTYMIFWMSKNSQKIKESFERKIDLEVSKGHKVGIFFLSFFAVFREGVETVLFLGATFVMDRTGVFFGIVFAIVLVLFLAFLMFKGVYNVNIKKFFTYTSVILIVFASGLIAYGVHELNEANIVPSVIEHVWDTNHILNEKGNVGSTLKSLVGYNGNPSLTEVLSYIFYWIFVGGYVFRRVKI